MCQSISLGKDDLCQCISFGINDLCQKLSAICHQYRTAPHKFRISAGHILTNCFFARSGDFTIFLKILEKAGKAKDLERYVLAINSEKQRLTKEP